MDAKQYIGDGVYAAFDSSTLSVILTTEDGERATNRIVLEPEVLDALGRFTQAAIYERQRPKPQPLDARAHAGEGEDAALEAGAGTRLTGIPDPDPREPVITKGEIDAAARPTIYSCGCSRLKVAAGLCSIYDEHGTERSE